MPTVILALLLVLVFLILWQIVARIGRRYIKFPAPNFIASFLDSGFRRATQPPGKIAVDSGIKAGMQVLEIGCGSGAFTIAATRAAAQAGKVYALDIQEDMLKKLKAKLTRPENSDVQNIEIINKSAYELPFAENSFNVVLMVTVLKEIPDQQRVLNEIKRILKPGGILSVSEYLVDPDYPWKSTTKHMVTQARFIFNTYCGNIWSYTVRFRKP